MAIITNPHTFGMWEPEGSAVKMNEMFNQLGQYAGASFLNSQQAGSSFVSNDLLSQLARQQQEQAATYGQSIFGVAAVGGGGGSGAGGSGGVGGMAIDYGRLMGVPGLQGVAPNHFGQVRQMRKKFKEISKEEFRHLSKEPVVKHILMGAIKLDKEQITERIKEHIDAV